MKTKENRVAELTRLLITYLSEVAPIRQAFFIQFVLPLSSTLSFLQL
jgi:hypothetical protein